MGWGVSILSNATTYHKSCSGLLSNSDNTQFFSTAWQLANLKVLKSFRIHFVPKSYCHLIEASFFACLVALSLRGKQLGPVWPPICIWKGSEIGKGEPNVALLLLLCRLEHRCTKHDLCTLPSTFRKMILKKNSPALPIAGA